MFRGGASQVELRLAAPERGQLFPQPMSDEQPASSSEQVTLHRHKLTTALSPTARAFEMARAPLGWTMYWTSGCSRRPGKSRIP